MCASLIADPFKVLVSDVNLLPYSVVGPYDVVFRVCQTCPGATETVAGAYYNAAGAKDKVSVGMRNR